jgi:hypothetical protein
MSGAGRAMGVSMCRADVPIRAQPSFVDFFRLALISGSRRKTTRFSGLLSILITA